jgi:uncharacterized protein (DUF2236 family)
MIDLSEFPAAQATRDYQNGLGFDDNPYPKSSAQYDDYWKEMNRNLNIELGAIRRELKESIL